jgi:hypothetical protein
LQISDGTVHLPGRTAKVVSTTDVVVVGAGPAGTTAAVSAARNGARVTLIERYAALGGMASGGFVLVLDDMINGEEITVRGITDEFVERMALKGLAVYPPEPERGVDPEFINKWTRWGLFDFHQPGKPKPIVYAVAFDPEGWKDVSNELVRESGVELRLHSWFSETLVEDGVAKGVVVQTKEGPQAILADVVIDASGDADVAHSAGAPVMTDQYIVSTVFRLGRVDVEAAERFEQESPTEARKLNRTAKQILGGSWDLWWLRTPLDGVVWCNCPHMSGYEATSPSSLTAAQFEGRERVAALVDYARAYLPGFEKAQLLDVAPQLGVRQSRMIEGEYVVTKSDVQDRRHFADSVARGRDYYTPYRALVPRGVDQLLVAGRHYSATPDAQRLSREIPPCMSMGQATGVAAALALDRGVHVRDVDVTEVQRRLRDQGADPGDVPSANASIDAQTEVSV